MKKCTYEDIFKCPDSWWNRKDRDCTYRDDKDNCHFKLDKNKENKQ